MLVNLVIQKERFESLKQYCSTLDFKNVEEKYSNITDSQVVDFEVEIDSSIDVLQIFHAGIQYGVQQGVKPFIK